MIAELGKCGEKDDKVVRKFLKWKCQVCGRIFNSRAALLDHIMDDHDISRN